MEIEQIRDILQAKYPDMDAVAIRYEDLVFEERVRLKCFQCRNYRTKWTCPGRLPAFDFPRLLGEYEHMAIIICRQQSVVSSQQSAVSSQASMDGFREAGNNLHRAMLYLEKELFNRNEPMATSFIGGSCELCKDGCNKDACVHPEQARIPWDATGCNVTRSLANIGIEVDFSGKEICRYGLLLW